jgi:predicted transcriptional regulator
MDSKKLVPRPTEAELSILRVLWRQGPATVRQVMEALCQEKPTGYTTVLKLMQIMFEKGLLKRDMRERVHVYRPAVAAEKMQKRLVQDLLDRVLEGSTRKLVMHALDGTKISEEELAEIRALLDQAEERKS